MPCDLILYVFLAVTAALKLFMLYCEYVIIITKKQILLQILIQFEGGIKRDWLTSDFETTTELNSCTFPGKIMTQSDESVPWLPWIPRTSAAVALRLFELDTSIFYNQHQKAEAHKMEEAGKFEVEFFNLLYYICDKYIYNLSCEL